MNIVALLLLILPASILVFLYVVPPGALPFRRILDFMRLNLPLIGKTTRLLCLSRWCGAMGAMIAAGVPESEAVRLAGALSGNAQIERLGQRLAESVTGGEPLWRAMALQRFFPRPLTWMLEKAAGGGSHARVWQLAREMYVRQTRHSGYIISVVLRVLLGVLGFQVVVVAAYTIIMPLMTMMSLMCGLSG